MFIWKRPFGAGVMISAEKEKAITRLKDAFEFIESAKENLDKSRFKVALMNAGDAVISANDAFTIFILQEVATRDHSEAVILHKKAGNVVNQNKINILSSVLDKRHKFGYRPAEVSKRFAEGMVNDAIKFVKWVVEIVK